MLSLPEVLARSGLVLLGTALLALRTGAQQREPYVPEQEPQAPQQPLPDDPSHALEFAIGGDGLWFAYRSGLHRGNGYGSLGLFVSEDNDLVLEGRLMRFGEPSAEAPLGIGVGLGLLAADVDDVNDKVYAITITGAADYALDQAFDLAYPTRAGVELSYAPGVATFADGDRVLEILGRVEMDLSAWATAFVGYRHLELDLENEDDATLDSAFQAGVRLGF